MLSANERITPRQFQILFVLEAFGTGFVVMPRIAAAYAGQDGWIAALLLVLPGLFFVALVSFTAMNAAMHSGGERFAVYIRRLLSAPIGGLVCLLLWAKILFCAGLELRLFGGIVHALLLSRTPALAVYIAVLAVAGYAAAKGIETRARLAEILIVIIAVPMLVLGAVALFNIDFTNLMPTLTTPPEDLAKGVLSLGFIFTGIEFIWLAFPYLNKPQEGPRAAISAMALSGVLMAVITAFTLAKFGPYNVQALEWPILKMMDMITIPGSLIARQEALILSFWMLSLFAFMAASLFYSAALARDQVKRGEHIWWVLASAAIICAVALIPLSRDKIYWILNQMFLTFGLGFWVGLPIIVTVVRKLRKKSVPILLITLMLSGCWDSVELENRGFALAIEIDTAEEARFKFSATLAQSDDENDEDENKALEGEGQTIIEAMHKLDSRSSLDLFLGQVKTVVLGKEVLKDREKFIEAVNFMENCNELDRSLTVLAADGETGLEYHIVNFYRMAPKSGGRSFLQNFESMTADLRATGNTLIPGPLPGAYVIKDYELAGELDGDELRGLLWFQSGACEGAVLTLEGNTPMVVQRHRTSLHFSEVDGRLMCIADIRVKGEIPYFEGDEVDTREVEQLIAAEITRTASKLQEELEVDAGNMRTTLRRRRYSLYRRYAEDWDRAFREMEIIPVVRTEQSSILSGIYF